MHQLKWFEQLAVLSGSLNTAWGASNQHHSLPNCPSFPNPRPFPDHTSPIFQFSHQPFDFSFPVVHPALAKCHPQPLSSITLPSQGDHAHQKLPPSRATLLSTFPKSCCFGQEKTLHIQSIFLITETPANRPSPSQAAQPLWEQQTRGGYSLSVPKTRQSLLPQPAMEN